MAGKEYVVIALLTIIIYLVARRSQQIAKEDKRNSVIKQHLGKAHYTRQSGRYGPVPSKELRDANERLLKMRRDYRRYKRYKRS